MTERTVPVASVADTAAILEEQFPEEVAWHREQAAQQERERLRAVDIARDYRDWPEDEDLLAMLEHFRDWLLADPGDSGDV